MIIEGGKQTLQTFIDENLWDEARVFRGNLLLKMEQKPQLLTLKNHEKQSIENDELINF